MPIWEDAKRNARLARLMFEVAMPTTPSNAVQRIQLCKEGLLLTDNVGFQSMLHYKLGMAYAESPQGEPGENTERSGHGLRRAPQR
jgi:hypothetical protein